jgi:hypothetical protein
MSQTQTAVQKEISALEEKLKQADLTNDPDILEELLADDAVLTGADGKPFTKAFVVERHHPKGEKKFTRFEATDFKIQDLGEVAIVTVRLDLAGKGFEIVLRNTRVWARRRGRWQIVAGHMSEEKTPKK